ncbi:hypothetical protein LR48_Vigan11g002600 [Vigna angularis]|uniref:Uncharacterized protein n=1 Tax=Phaseolus angularis TaxID=3914 RepID=A0A0L9VQI7_PHAAN|nr:hypothetical protein LR48_Vigan11g002600 [Vigna angularis]
MTVEGPPPPEESRSKVVDAAALAGPDIGRTAGRGIPPTPVVQAQPGLTGPVCGVGGPAPGMMQPQFSRPSQLNAPPYPGGPPVMCPPGQMLGQFAPPPMARGPPPPMPPEQFVPPRPGGEDLRLLCAPPPPRPGMPPPPGNGVSVFGPPRPGMPPSPNPPNQQ